MRDTAGGREAVNGGQMPVLNKMVRTGLIEKVGSEHRITVSLRLQPHVDLGGVCLFQVGRAPAACLRNSMGRIQELRATRA